LTSEGPSRGARTVFAAALAIYVAAAAWLLWRTAILEPYSDMFDWLDRYWALRDGGRLGAYLWAPHNVHHLVWTFAILAGDIRLFGASSALFLAAGAGCLAATAALLAWMAAKAAEPRLRLPAAGAAAALSAMGCHVLDASADINTTYLHALVFAVAAVALAEARPRGWPLTAILCAAAAGLGNGAGLAVWPALVAGAALRRDRRWAIAVAVAGLAFGLVYLIGEPARPLGVFTAGRWLAAGQLFLTYLGLPWSRGLDPFGWVLGAAALCASAWALWRSAQTAEWPRRAAVGLIVFSLGTAALAAGGRGGLIRPDQPPMRYAVFLIPLQVGLLIAALPALSWAWRSRPRAMDAALIALSALMLIHQALMADYAVRTADGVRQALAAFHAGRQTPAMLTRIYPDLAKARSIDERLRREGLYQRELRP